MGEGPSVEVVANLAKEFSVRGEFEKLRGGGTVSRTRCVAAEKTKMCPLELTATPTASPRWVSGGSFKKLGAAT